MPCSRCTPKPASSLAVTASTAARCESISGGGVSAWAASFWARRSRSLSTTATRLLSSSPLASSCLIGPWVLAPARSAKSRGSSQPPSASAAACSPLCNGLSFNAASSPRATARTRSRIRRPVARFTAAGIMVPKTMPSGQQ